VSLIDIFIISRENKRLGIPDECMIFGDVTLTPMVRRFIMMPIFVLASRVCPDGAEATLYALLMALSNFGNTVGIYFGSFLLVIFGVTDDNYDNFIYVVVVKSLCRLLPILFIPFLVPDGSAQEHEDCDDNDTDSQVNRNTLLNGCIVTSSDDVSSPNNSKHNLEVGNVNLHSTYSGLHREGLLTTVSEGGSEIDDERIRTTSESLICI
jgi:hypothetical protein